MRHIVELLAHPGEAIPALILVSQAQLPAGHEHLDQQACDTYIARARELLQELDECQSNNDTGRAEILRAELDALVEQIEKAVGQGNRPPASTDDPERARTAVRKAIKRAIDTIDRQHPRLARHLRGSITTGTTCGYAPPPDAAIEWSIHR
jgi:hypothetical protein